MNRLKFLIKPAFFIISLVGCTWMTLEIEKISPSDAGKTFLPQANAEVIKPKFVSSPSDIRYLLDTKELLRSLCVGYKSGIIDSAELDARLNQFIIGIENYHLKTPIQVAK